MIDNKFYTFSSYLKDYELTPSEEDYIEMIYRISLESTNEIKVTELAKMLNIKPPSVTKMIKKLSGKGLLNSVKYGCITLTSLGNEIGEKLLTRHNIIEKFLSLIGDTDNLLEKTEKLEHVVNSETLEAINKLVVYLELINYK